MIKPTYSKEFLDRVSARMKKLYPQNDILNLQERLQLSMGRYGVNIQPEKHSGGVEKLRWSEKDAVLITYADSLLHEERSPLKQLTHFATDHLGNAINTIHLLPFFPWSSDDGFSVINYRQVDPGSGTWNDITGMRNHFRLMFDWVLNHVSARSQWFKYYANSVSPYREFFIEESPETDLSLVTRPRTSPLLTKVETRHGTKHVWTTFSADQVDLNWANPDVFFEMLDTLLFYINQGATVIRMDAVAFLWKEMGTTCLHHENTHEIIRLLRNIMDVVAPEVILLTETNVPHEENISYFGQGDEAHMVYQFSLPPLLLHGLLREDASHLSQWAASLPPLPDGCTFFNFTASHDGIGMRPLQGILPDEELNFLVESVQARRGKVSFRSMPDGSQTPYELNCTYFSALSDPDDPFSEASAQRFLVSQHVAMALQGIPGIYIHSLLASPNDVAAAESSGINRRINRRKLSEKELNAFLADTGSVRHRIFHSYLEALKARNACDAFHPDVPQEIHNLDEKVFIVKRCHPTPSDSVTCIHNFSSSAVSIDTTSLLPSGNYTDLLSGNRVELSEPALTIEPLSSYWLKTIR